MIIIINCVHDLETDRKGKARALENLIASHGECKNIIWMPKNIASELRGLDEFGDYTKRVLIEIESFAREARGLENDFSFHVVIDFKEQNRLELIDNKALHIGYNHFVDSASTQKAALITENIKDAETFIIGAEIYLHRTKNLGGLKISFNKTPGGGNNVYETYQQHTDNETFFLCIIDSDLKHPKGPIGSTAKRFNKESVGALKKRHLSILKCHEIENIIPIAIIREVSGGKIDEGILVKNDRLMDYRAFPDHKAGLCADKAKEQDEEYQDNHWSEFYPYSNCGKTSWLIPPLGENLLSKCLQFMSERSTPKISEYINPEKDSIWWETSKLVASWGIAPKRSVR